MPKKIANIDPDKPLTRKQKAFADYLLNNPKASATEAIKATYNVTTNASAGVTANENLKKPNVFKYLHTHSINAEQVITDFLTLKDSDKVSEKRLAYDSATQVLDRVHGKPTQTVVTEGRHITLNIDSSDLNLVS